MKIEPFKIEEWMNKYEASAKYDLTTTCIKPLSIEDLSIFIGFNNFDVFKTPLTYGDITGSERLKTAVKSLYKNQNTDNITITHGAIGANQLVFLSLINAWDKVVSIVPTYQQHCSIPRQLGADVQLYFLKEENNWLPDIKELSKLITPETKLLCLNNPNNPTGAVIPDDLLEVIVELARKNDCWILSDEVYRGLNLAGNNYSKSVADIYPKGISVGSMSKTYSLPGLRVGWICACADLINEINHQRQYNTISVSALDDYFAALALENRDLIERRNLKLAQAGMQTFMDWVSGEPLVECIAPEAGTTALLRYKKDIPSKELCFKLQQQTGVAILPGETMEMEGYLRVGFCAENLDKALKLFSWYLLGS